MNKHLKTLVVTAAASLLAAFNANAVVPVSLNADADGWTGWTSQHSTGNTSQAGHFIGTATGTGATGSQIDTNGKSWALYANSGQTAAMIYDFGGTLGVGDSVSIAFDNGWINNGGTVGFGLQNSSGTNRFEFYFVGGQSSYVLNDAGGPQNVDPFGINTTLGYTADGVGTITFIQGSSNAYNLLINGNPVDNTGLTLQASDISRIRLFAFDTGTGSNHDQYFNSLVVVPEPSTYALIIGGLAMLIFIARRRAATNS
jgi:hypothetical protein